MGNKQQSINPKYKNESECYFNVTSNKLSKSNTDSPKEKIQLKFKIITMTLDCMFSLELFMFDQEEDIFRLIGITEEESLKSDNSNKVIDFKTIFYLDYFFEKNQLLQIVVKTKENGSILKTFTIGKIMGTRGQFLSFSILENTELIINAYPSNESSSFLNFTMTLDTPECVGLSLFYILKQVRIVSNEQLDIPVYKSEVINVKNIPMSFNTIKIPTLALCNCDYDSRIDIDIYDYGTGKILKNFPSSVRNLDYSVITFSINKNNSQIVSCHSNIERVYSFADYLRGGLQIALTIGIDFTASNGALSDPTSLHFNETNTFNCYEKAIRECGDIVAYYDYDQLFPVFGYGAILPGDQKVNHCFNLNFLPDPNIQTITGVLEVYRSALLLIKLHGPTHFRPLIQKVIDTVKKVNNNNVYNILMIMTDGNINDMDKTIDALVEASFLPISVIIIGIGDCDFSNMTHLDADENTLVDSSGKKAARDVVQFVPFNKFKNNPQKLAEEVLEEVPQQVVEYFQLYSIEPNAAININI